MMDNAEASLILKVDYNMINYPNLCRLKVGEDNFLLARYIMRISDSLPIEHEQLFNELSMIDGAILYR